MPEEPSQLKFICCADVVPGCTFTANAATEEALIQQVAAHASEQHGVKEITPELVAKVQAAIQTR